MKDSRFSKAYAITAQHEGGYAFVKGDRGGQTYKGIARNFHGSWKGWLIIDAYKSLHGKIPHNYVFDNDDLQLLVEEFYYEKFYKGYQIDKIESEPLAIQLYDSVVLSGSNAIILLQKSCNMLSNDAPLKVDGLIGKNTVLRVNSIPEEPLHDTFRAQRMGYLDRIGQRPTQKKFRDGWLKRASSFPQLLHSPLV